MFFLPEEQSITCLKTRQSAVSVRTVFLSKKLVKPEMAGNFGGLTKMVWNMNGQRWNIFNSLFSDKSFVVAVNNRILTLSLPSQPTTVKRLGDQLFDREAPNGIFLKAIILLWIFWRKQSREVLFQAFNFTCFILTESHLKEKNHEIFSQTGM